ncbi:hypothetical protein ACUY24_06710 [Corynebacterium simulans]|uniref:Uncharacterized protein n=1 Tax=Corynebacterium accolens TaxID=38284 RepID=A0A2A4AMH2_9CORY|nr:hypothetical protein [Corynebacterium sp. HMSC077D03]OFR40795.1 hypothetical protein HMPREF2888_04750 [Corynebacterium sp. HMSC077D03]PCC83692.1 hypothetical protein COM45_02800 [Corynebacterium accolens]
MRFRSAAAAAGAALCLMGTPFASAASSFGSSNAAESATQTETAYTGGFTYYTSQAEDFANVFRCSTSPQRWWCGRSH